MPSMRISELRDTRRLKTWLRAGKIIELRERDEVIARIVPEGRPAATGEWPDFAAMRQEILNNRRLPGAKIVSKDRGRY